MRLEDIHLCDPFVLAHEGKYYMYGTRGLERWTDEAFGLDVYISEDLVEWSGPKEIFKRTPEFPYTMNYWAPEVYKYDNRFFMFVSFKAPDVCRGTAVLVSDTPDGIFTMHSDGPVTPKEWECLDGTLYIAKDGTPHMVFCHEWVQTTDGQMCVIPLTKDLKAAAGEPRLLFTASQSEWINKPAKVYITDGPFMYRMQNGDLYMLWSASGKGGYSVGLVKSDNGDISGNWTHIKEPLFEMNGGHAMIFDTYDGRKMLSLHAPEYFPQERPRFYEVKETEEGWLTVIL